MSGEIAVGDEKYISSKRASETSGYAQDYIGQLARKGLIEARRIGGLWYVLMDSLLAYKTKADGYKRIPPVHTKADNPKTVISFDGKDHISATRASEITGYHQDYVAQLAREGKIASRQVGKRWYVGRSEIVSHKKEKDALLAAVQAESVGLWRQKDNVHPETLEIPSYNDAGPHLNYTSDEGDLMPVFGEKSSSHEMEVISSSVHEVNTSEHPIPIRVLRTSQERAVTVPVQSISTVMRRVKPIHKRVGLNSMLLPAVVGTILIVISISYISISNSSLYASADPSSNLGTAFVSSTNQTLSRVIGIIEKMLVPETIYHRAE